MLIVVGQTKQVVELTIFHLYAHFAADDFCKLCIKRQNAHHEQISLSLEPQCYQLYSDNPLFCLAKGKIAHRCFQSYLLPICCMWKRVIIDMYIVLGLWTESLYFLYLNNCKMYPSMSVVYMVCTCKTLPHIQQIGEQLWK